MIPMFQPKSNMKKVMDLEEEKVGIDMIFGYREQIFVTWLLKRCFPMFDLSHKNWIILNVILSSWKLELKPLLVVRLRWKDKSWKVHLDTRHLINKADLVLSHVQKWVPKSNIKILGLSYVPYGCKLFALAYFYVA